MKKLIGLALVLIAIIIAAVYFGTSVSETAQAENDYLRIHVRAYARFCRVTESV